MLNIYDIRRETERDRETERQRETERERGRERESISSFSSPLDAQLILFVTLGDGCSL